MSHLPVESENEFAMTRMAHGTHAHSSLSPFAKAAKPDLESSAASVLNNPTADAAGKE